MKGNKCGQNTHRSLRARSWCSTSENSSIHFRPASPSLGGDFLVLGVDVYVQLLPSPVLGGDVFFFSPILINSGLVRDLVLNGHLNNVV